MHPLAASQSIYVGMLGSPDVDLQAQVTLTPTQAPTLPLPSPNPDINFPTNLRDRKTYYMTLAFVIESI